KVSAEPQRVAIQIAGEITDIIPMPRRSAIDALDDQHVWTTPLIDMRFNYRPENPLYLLLVRSYVLPGQIMIENTPAYAGCKSWVPLDAPISTEGARASLDDQAYAARRKLIMDRLH